MNPVHDEDPLILHSNQSCTEYRSVESSTPPNMASRMLPFYKKWAGRNRFCFGGRCITGPSDDTPQNLCVWFSIVIPTILFFVFASPKLWKITPAVPILVAIACLCTLS